MSTSRYDPSQVGFVSPWTRLRLSPSGFRRNEWSSRFGTFPASRMARGGTRTEGFERSLGRRSSKQEPHVETFEGSLGSHTTRSLRGPTREARRSWERHGKKGKQEGAHRRFLLLRFLLRNDRGLERNAMHRLVRAPHPSSTRFRNLDPISENRREEEKGIDRFGPRSCVTFLFLSKRSAAHSEGRFELFLVVSFFLYRSNRASLAFVVERRSCLETNQACSGTARSRRFRRARGRSLRGRRGEEAKRSTTETKLHEKGGNASVRAGHVFRKRRPMRRKDQAPIPLCAWCR